MITYAFGLQIASNTDQVTIDKLEEIFVVGCDKAIAEGYTIVAGRYHPTDKTCCPIFAACKDKRYHQVDTWSIGYPLYEQIISELLGEEFDLLQLRSFLDGFDGDKSFMHYTHTTPHRDEPVFNLARRLRKKYVLKENVIELPDYAENAQGIACMTDAEIAHYVEKMKLPNAIFGHVNWCIPCRKRLEEAYRCITAHDAMGFFQSHEIKELALRHINKCYKCSQLMNKVAEEPPSSMPIIPIERAMVLYRPKEIQEWDTVQHFSFFAMIAEKWQQMKNWLNRWLWT